MKALGDALPDTPALLSHFAPLLPAFPISTTDPPPPPWSLPVARCVMALWKTRLLIYSKTDGALSVTLAGPDQKDVVGNKQAGETVKKKQKKTFFIEGS